MSSSVVDVCDSKISCGYKTKERNTLLSVLLGLKYSDHRALNPCSFMLSCLETGTGVWTILHSDQCVCLTMQFSRMLEVVEMEM
jgi:hypothetical protein